MGLGLISLREDHRVVNDNRDLWVAKHIPHIPRGGEAGGLD